MTFRDAPAHPLPQQCARAQRSPNTGVVRFPVQPRLVSPEKVARRLGVTYAVFQEKRSALEQAGFPKPEPIVGNYHLEAVDRWIDARAGVTPTGAAISDPSVIAERVRAKAWAK